MKIITLTLILIVFYSCGSKDETTIESKTTLKDSTNVVNQTDLPVDFKDYLIKFKNADLPISIDGCSYDFENMIELNDKQYRKFINHDLYPNDQSFFYKRIPSNGNYITTITLRATDCFLPVLTTYNTRGEIIDEKTIAIGYCGSDCGFNCEEFMTIKKDFSIYVSDTISRYQCDSLAEEIASTHEYYVIYKKGKLLSNGKIQLTNEIKKNLKK
jgi:hypothetical protein